MRRGSTPRLPVPSTAFAGFRFPGEVIVLGVRWYLRFNLSYRDLEELLAERGIAVDHVTLYRWVTRFTPLLIDAARFPRHAPGDKWFVDETYIKVVGKWTYLPGDRSVRAGHRRDGLPQAGPAGRPAVLCPGAAAGSAGAGDHRPGRFLPACPGRAATAGPPCGCPLRE